VTHSSSGWAVQLAKCTRRLAISMKKSTYTRRSQIVSTVKKSTAIRLFVLRVKELTPRWTVTPTRWTQMCLASNLPHRRRRHDNAQAFQFAHDPLIAPARVFARDPQNQFSRLGTDRAPQLDDTSNA
jgi:hypothetical protein